MGDRCLFKARSPRLALLILWLFTPMVNVEFGDNWLWPLLGLLFLPFTATLTPTPIASRSRTIRLFGADGLLACWRSSSSAT